MMNITVIEGYLSIMETMDEAIKQDERDIWNTLELLLLDYLGDSGNQKEKKEQEREKCKEVRFRGTSFEAQYL